MGTEGCPHPEAVREIIRETVFETLKSLGIDVTHPMEVQADLRSLREWRQSMKAIWRSAVLGFVGILITGACAALWIGIKYFIVR